MGLGPPICIDCKIILTYQEEIPHWYCPVCGSSKREESLWELSPEDQVTYRKNTEKVEE